MVILRSFMVFLLLLLLGGCSSLGYYAQSIHGQLDLLGRRQSIERLIAEPDTSEALRERLRLVLEMRGFASRELGLPENGSYRSYADLQRSAMVWSVVATPEFSMQPKQWCYLVVGCASYRGYFKKAVAEGFADGLKREGLDVVVESIPAYSTLGWFDDPLPSTVINWPEPRLASLIFHELAHQRIYFPDDSNFNEAFASVVAQVGVERWLRAKGSEEAIIAWRQTLERQQAFIDLLLKTRGRLIELYSGTLPADKMGQSKAQEFKRLRDNYAGLRLAWDGYGGYDHWFNRELNNAHLASVATYQQQMPALLLLLQRHRGDLAAFYDACEGLAKLSPQERAEQLLPMLIVEKALDDVDRKL